MKKTIQENSINAGFCAAKLITKRHAKTFFFASRFLPKDKQRAAYSVYAICRISDDSVDNTQRLLSPDMLGQIKEKIEAAYAHKKLDDDLLLAFKSTVDKYQIPKRYFDELIEGMYMDLNKNIYKNFAELYDYCYKVAGVVGLIMLKIFGHTHLEAEEYAKDLGIAMQLTNILRDIKEDYQRGRIYLPQDEMNKFGVLENQIAKRKLDENLIALFKFQIKRARKFYNKSNEGIRMIANLKSRLVVRIMKEMYAGILQSIEKNNYDVFTKRAHINYLGKLTLALKILLNPDVYKNQSC